MSGEPRKLKKEWLLFGGAVLVVVCLLGAGLSFQTLRARWVARGLHSNDPFIQMLAVGKLKTLGTPGRLAMLSALDEPDELLASGISCGLIMVLDQDLKEKHDVAPVVRAALRGMREPGAFGHRCAGIASIGWEAGLLNDDEKRDIVRRCLEFDFAVHPAYPPGGVGPRMRITTPKMSDTIQFHFVVEWRSDDAQWIESEEDDFGAYYMWGRYAKAIGSVPKHPGSYTIRPKVKVSLGTPWWSQPFATSVKDQDTAPSTRPWSTEFALDPVTFKVDDRLPADYLQAKVTPELEVLMKSAVSLSTSTLNSEYRDRTGKHWIRFYCPELRMKLTQRCDMACRPRWYVVEMDKTFDGPDIVWLKKGEWWEDDVFPGREWDKTRTFLDEPDDFFESITKLGEQQFTIRITLEPSFRAALGNPEVKAYWPKAIELPEFIMKVDVREETGGGYSFEKE